VIGRGLGNRLSVAVRLKLGEIQPLQKIGVKKLRAVKGATGGGGGEPGDVAALTVLGSWNQEWPPKTSSADSPDSAT
jgi:hypothetical protein